MPVGTAQPAGRKRSRPRLEIRYDRGLREEERLIAPKINASRIDPMIDQKIGNGLPSTLTSKIFGKSRAPASHSPTQAPANPIAIETRQPPRENPARLCPTAPQMAEINNNSKNPNRLIVSFRGKNSARRSQCLRRCMPTPFLLRKIQAKPAFHPVKLHSHAATEHFRRRAG